MPRRKQDCPKRMKWELENLGLSAKLGLPATTSGKEVQLEDDNHDGTESSEDEASSAETDTDVLDSPKKPISPAPNGNDQKQFTDTRRCPAESPLDLSVSHNLKDPRSRKKVKIRDFRPSWNGSLQSMDLSSNALEKMSELSRIGATEPSAGVVASTKGSTSSWQAQWLAQSAYGTKDVLRCVCCRLTFPSLSALSTHMKESKHGPAIPSSSSPPKPHSTHASNHNNASTSSNDPSPLLKETVHLPRKLVRGQDVWLGKGAEQTRQILKCMWCGQSFRSLAEMTSHMQQTQHYTNIISQEQLISWRSHEDKSASASSHVSAVLTCKVCDQAFSSLKELSNHMVKNSHYKEHIMRSITESGSRRRQSREKRKKSLPVRKLLELERANTGVKKEVLISCEKCLEKVPAPAFVEHLRVCEKSEDRPSLLKTINTAYDAPSKPKKEFTEKISEQKSEPSSVLNAIEKMIEKSFDYQTKGVNSNSSISSPVGTSILKRLGIDESVDYTKPLIDPCIAATAHRITQHRPKSTSSEPTEQQARTPSSDSPQNSATEEEDKVILNEVPEEQIQQTSPRSRNASTKMNSLCALNSMFDLIGGNQDAKTPASPDQQDNTRNQHSSPISALQKFCDKRTESSATASRPTSASSSNSQSPGGVDATALLGLNWSLNEGENAFKCNFCDSSFMSKGAYRHHLAKMHFVKDEKDPVPAKNDPHTHSDSPASKFIKYSELAKQLSSK